MGSVTFCGASCNAMLLLGPTGAGKTPLGELIEKEGLLGRKWAHFDFGSWLRRAAAGEGDSLGLSSDQIARVKDVLAEGLLLEDNDFHIAIRIFRSFLSLRRVEGRWIILNGLPRHVGQASALDSFIRVHFVVNLEASDEIIFQRIRENVGGDRTVRDDDVEEAIRQRIERYRNRTIRLLDFYAAKGVEIIKMAVGLRSSASQMLAELRNRLEQKVEAARICSCRGRKECDA